MIEVKIAACVILYNPDPSIEYNINSYISAEKIYILDNSSYPSKQINSLINQSKIHFIHNGFNEGISKRLNQACTLAKEEGFDYLLTMDQDSYFDVASITAYFKCLDDFKEKSTVAMFGINHEQKKITGEGCFYKECKFLITSGSIINLEAYKTIGPFDENLFIDFVDVEYCFRSIDKGFRIIKFPNIFMHHSLGEKQIRISLKNLKHTQRTFHSSVRLYYMLRNFLYLNSKYKNRFKEEITVNKKDLLNRIKNSLLYKNKRMQTIKMLLKAFKDYRNKSMGKLQD